MWYITKHREHCQKEGKWFGIVTDFIVTSEIFEVNFEALRLPKVTNSVFAHHEFSQNDYMHAKYQMSPI